MAERKLFLQNKFNKKYEIIGDFDLFIRLSEITQIGYVNECLATYRIHSTNLSKKKKNIHIRELSSWIKNNKKKFDKKGLPLYPIKLNLLKLKIQNLISFR